MKHGDAGKQRANVRAHFLQLGTPKLEVAFFSGLLLSSKRKNRGVA